MQLKQIYLKNFRCFTEIFLNFQSPIVLIEGLNGAGKTSLLEALHYLCYLRSFRTHSPRELLQAGKATFFIKAVFTQEAADGNQEVQVGFSGAKRLVKINQKVISSFKELLDHYRIVTLTADDIALITDGPDVRRAFIDQLIVLYMIEYAAKLRAVRYIADNRNRLLQNPSRDRSLYDVLTQQLWAASQDVQHERQATITRLARAANTILQTYFNESIEVSLEYKPKMVVLTDSFEQFLQDNPTLYHDEQRYGRSLFGAHLDDFSIHFAHKRSKSFASRGQQKLIILLIKIAQIQELVAKKGSAVFLLDDFMTDFDEKRVKTILSILSDLNIQLIFTAPSRAGTLEDALMALGAQKILLTH